MDRYKEQRPCKKLCRQMFSTMHQFTTFLSQLMQCLADSFCPIPCPFATVYVFFFLNNPFYVYIRGYGLKKYVFLSLVVFLLPFHL